MAPPNEGPSPYEKHGSVDDSQKPTSYGSLLPRSARCRSSSYPAMGEKHPLQHNLRDPEAGRSASWRLVVAVVCSFAFVAVCSVLWGRSTASQSTAATLGFFEIGADAGDIANADMRPIRDPSSAAAVAPAAAAAVATLEFTALNYYHVRDGKPGQDYPWLKDVKLIEPHRDTTLAVVGAREGFDYRWEVRAGSSSSSSGGVGEVQATATGAVTIVVLTQLDENIVVLEEVDGDGKVTNRLEEVVMVKYVRREIRTLTDDEREELLDAMFQLWAVRVDGGNGKELYGEDYADIYAINRLHFKAATNGTCDHFHDGMGFLVSHSLITNTFEFSLQRVNPKLTVPYWDFTIETTAAAGLAYDPKNPFTRTELLSPSWFGTADLDDKMVKDGRWAYTEIPNVYEGNPGFLESDVYGKLRSPWNTNDRPYISRAVGEQCQAGVDGYLTWPNCRDHYELVTTNSAFYAWVWDSMGSSHGPVHLWLGGNIDCDSAYNQIGDLVGAEIAEIFAFLANGHRKGLFCAKVWGCKRNASVDEKPKEVMSSGTCGCQGYDLTQGDDYQTVMGMLSYVEFYIGGYSEDIQRQVVALICNGVTNFGEHSQSSSTLDPTFWPMHGTMERMYQFAVVTETITDFTWPDKDIEVTLPDGTSYTQYVSSYYEECNGHHGSHIFPFGLLGSDIDGFKVKTGIRSNPITGNTLTNREVLEAFDPRSNSMNYVYDTFKWDHCVSKGYDFDDAWGDTMPTARKDFFETDEPRSAVYTSFKRKMAKIMKEEGDRLKEEEGEAPSG